MSYHVFFEGISFSGCINDSIIITPNNRLSQYLFKSYASYIQKTSFKKIWQSPNIIPINELIVSLWQDASDYGFLPNSFYLLSEFQKQILFERIIENSFSENLKLLNKKISSKVVSAWNLMKSYDIDFSLLENYKYPEVDSFKSLIKNYQNYVYTENRLFDNFDFLKFLMTLNSSQLKLILPQKNIFLIGFDELSPLFNSFFNFLQSNQYNINFPKFDDTRKVINKCYKFKDKELELDSVIYFSQNLIAKENQNLTIIVPNLTSVRNDIIKKFSDKFENRQDWNVSGGNFLIETPVINSFITILEFILSKKISIELAQEILRRPFYINENKEYLNKSKVIKNIREYNYSNEISLFEFKKYIKDLAPEFHQYLDDASNFIYKIKNNNLKFYPSEYSKIIMDCANKLGWPGAVREISSEEYQAIQSFQSALYELNKLDLILNKIEVNEYFILLKNYLSNLEFQIEVNDPKINILGILEGAGIEFDNLWFMSLNSELWPEEPSPNVFIPNEIQKQHNMPHSSFEREVEFASKIMSRLFNNSKNIITSFYEYDKQKQIYPSVFIHNIEHSDYVINNKLKEKNIGSNKSILEKYQDYKAPTINRKYIKNAIYALNLQLQCPFRSFAETRLNSEKFREIKFGITPIDRGNLLHNVMEKIWIKLKSKSGLLRFLDESAANIEKFILEIINSCFEKLHLEKSLYNDLCNVEKKRLLKIIKTWLLEESKRDNFSIAFTELEQNVKFENIYFTLRIDRIDTEVRNGLEHNIIIDYKISSQNTSNWLSSLSDIQMPMYYLMLNKKNNKKDYSGLLYSVINSKEQKFQGYIDNNFDFGLDIKSIDFNYYKQSWHEQIKILANQYLDGVAIKNPLNLDTTCKNCHLKSLCRLYD